MSFFLIHGTGLGANCWDELIPHLNAEALGVDLPAAGQGQTSAYARSLSRTAASTLGRLIALESMTCNVAHQSNDAREGVQAFLQKRDPIWTDS